MSLLKKKSVIKVGDQISDHAYSKQTSTRQLETFYDSQEYKHQQSIDSRSHVKSKVNSRFWKSHFMCPKLNELSIREAIHLRSKFKILVVADTRNHYKTVSVLINKLKFKNTHLAINLDEARKKIIKNNYDVVLVEAEIDGESTLKLAEYTSNLIVISGFNEAQKRNIVNAGLIAFPVNTKNVPATVLKIVLTMYDKFIGSN